MSKAEEHEAQFDAHAQNYDADLARGISLSGEGRDFFARGRVELLKKRLEERKFRPERILDFGCGDGKSTPLLLGLLGANTIVGMDQSAESISIAKRKYSSAQVSFTNSGEIRSPAGFDLVFCNGVFHHIPVAERASAVARVFAALRPGGLFAFWENNPWNPGTKFVMSRIPFDKDAKTLSIVEARRLLRQGEFQVLLDDFAFYFPRALAFLRRTEPLLRHVPLGAQYMILGEKAQRR